MGDIYQQLDHLLSEATATQVGFTQLISPEPYWVSPSFLEEYDRRGRAIRSFMSAAIKVFDDALNGDLDPIVLHLLINDTPASIGLEYHRQLLPAHKTSPAFFRTDEVAPGRIVEIQCPGSLWGDHQVMLDAYASNGAVPGSDDFTRVFSQSVHKLIGGQPIVHHLLDNSSIPHTTRYFIERTRPSLRYFGIDYSIRSDACNFVRSHSFFGLMAENHAKERLRRCGDGELRFDLPPMVLFDQKVVLALPFLPETSAYFTEEVRQALVYTQVLRPEGMLQEDGTWLSIEAIAKLSRGKRRLFLKYGGSDVSINWGARAVHDLDQDGYEKCLHTLEEKASEFRTGRIWLLQRAERHHEEVKWLTRHGELESGALSAKFSGFYGPAGVVGVCVQHRDFPKVHGSYETVFNVCAPRPSIGP